MRSPERIGRASVPSIALDKEIADSFYSAVSGKFPRYTTQNTLERLELVTWPVTTAGLWIATWALRVTAPCYPFRKGPSAAAKHRRPDPPSRRAGSSDSTATAFGICVARKHRAKWLRHGTQIREAGIVKKGEPLWQSY